MACRLALLGALIALLVGCGDDSDDAGQEGTLSELGLTQTQPLNLVKACRMAEAETTLPEVFCPPVVPVGPLEIQGVWRESRPYFDEAKRVKRSKEIAASYTVHLQSPSIDRQSLGHWSFEAGQRTPFLAGIPRDPIPKEPVDLGGTTGEILAMPPYPEGGVHGGHVVVRWRVDGVSYDVSLHGGKNTDRAVAMAQAMVDLMVE